jgi:histidinol-phosphate aminotransferase
MNPNPVVLNKSVYHIPHASSNQINLAINENLFDIPPAIIDNLKNNINNLFEYPPNDNLNTLKNNIGMYNNISPDHILVTNGSDNALKTIFETFLSPDSSILIPIPTYPHVELVISLLPHSEVSTFYTDPNVLSYNEIINLFKHHLSSKQYTIFYMCNPNMPFGYTLKKYDIELLITQFPKTLFIVDEAYLEYSNEITVSPLTSIYKNLIVTRTFSKFFAIASLRIGYLITHPDNMKYINVVWNDKNVTNFAIVAANTALNNLSFYHNQLILFKQSREFLIEHLSNIIHSDKFIFNFNFRDGNYFIIYCKTPSLCIDYFRSNGILIRDKSNDIPHAIRITIPPLSISTQLITLLTSLQNSYS